MKWVSGIQLDRYGTTGRRERNESLPVCHVLYSVVPQGWEEQVTPGESTLLIEAWI